MSSAFCSLDEAFTGPVMPGPKKKKLRIKGIEGFQNQVASVAPPALSGAPDPDRPAERPPPAPEAMVGAGGPPVKEAVDLQEFFPLPGETGDNESWEKAFTLSPDWTKTTPSPRLRADGSIPVDGAPTLWRQIPEPTLPPAAAAPAPIGSALEHRMEQLTRQLEALSAPTPMQSTAELFLFVAIGLLILLAIDTLLRYAVAAAQGFSGSLKGGARRLGRGRR